MRIPLKAKSTTPPTNTDLDKLSANAIRISTSANEDEDLFGDDGDDRGTDWGDDTQLSLKAEKGPIPTKSKVQTLKDKQGKLPDSGSDEDDESNQDDNVDPWEGVMGAAGDDGEGGWSDEDEEKEDDEESSTRDTGSEFKDALEKKLSEEEKAALFKLMKNVEAEKFKLEAKSSPQMTHLEAIRFTINYLKLYCKLLDQSLYPSHFFTLLPRHFTFWSSEFDQCTFPPPPASKFGSQSSSVLRKNAFELNLLFLRIFQTFFYQIEYYLKNKKHKAAEAALTFLVDFLLAFPSRSMQKKDLSNLLKKIFKIVDEYNNKNSRQPLNPIFYRKYRLIFDREVDDKYPVFEDRTGKPMPLQDWFRPILFLLALPNKVKISKEDLKVFIRKISEINIGERQSSKLDFMLKTWDDDQPMDAFDFIESIAKIFETDIPYYQDRMIVVYILKLLCEATKISPENILGELIRRLTHLNVRPSDIFLSMPPNKVIIKCAHPIDDITFNGLKRLLEESFFFLCGNITKNTFEIGGVVRHGFDIHIPLSAFVTKLYPFLFAHTHHKKVISQLAAMIASSTSLGPQLAAVASSYDESYYHAIGDTLVLFSSDPDTVYQNKYKPFEDHYLGDDKFTPVLSDIFDYIKWFEFDNYKWIDLIKNFPQKTIIKILENVKRLFELGNKYLDDIATSSTGLLEYKYQIRMVFDFFIYHINEIIRGHNFYQAHVSESMMFDMQVDEKYSRSAQQQSFNSALKTNVESLCHVSQFNKPGKLGEARGKIENAFEYHPLLLDYDLATRLTMQIDRLEEYRNAQLGVIGATSFEDYDEQVVLDLKGGEDSDPEAAAAMRVALEAERDERRQQARDRNSQPHLRQLGIVSGESKSEDRKDQKYKSNPPSQSQFNSLH